MAHRRGETYQGFGCNKGHSGIRYVRDGACVECRRLLWRNRNPIAIAAKMEKQSNRRSAPEWKKDQWGYRIEKLYGLTADDFEMRLVRQRGACAVCGTWDPKGSWGKWHVDHCRSTGVVRGLLCMHCNTSIGKLGDSSAGLMRAVRYLERFEGRA